MVQVIQLGTETVDPALEPWKDFAGRWQNWRSRFNRHHWPESWQGQAYQADRLVFPSPWDDQDLITRYSLRQGLLFGYVIQQDRRRALLLPGYLGAGHELEAIYLIQEQVLLHFPCSLAGSDWFLQVINVLLPELLSRPAVPPELVQAPLQLRIEGHPNFAHCLLNTYTCLEELDPESIFSVAITGLQPIAPLSNLFPEYCWVALDAIGSADKTFDVPLSQRPNQISAQLRKRIIDISIQDIGPQAVEISNFLTSWKSMGGWILWVSIKTRGAYAEDLPKFLAAWMRSLKENKIISLPLILLDGFSIQNGHKKDDDIYGTTIGGLINEEKELATQVKQTMISAGIHCKIVEAVGLPLLDTIALTQWADFYFCHQGTIQHKIGWIQSKVNGIIHSNSFRNRGGVHEWGGLGGLSPHWLPLEHTESLEQNSLNRHSPYALGLSGINFLNQKLEQAVAHYSAPKSPSINLSSKSIMQPRIDEIVKNLSLDAILSQGFIGEVLQYFEGHFANSDDIYHLLIGSSVYRASGDVEKSLILSEKALGLDANNTYHIYNYIINLQFGGRSSEIISYCQQKLQDPLVVSDELCSYLKLNLETHSILKQTSFAHSGCGDSTLQIPEYLYLDTNQMLRSPVRVNRHDFPNIQCKEVVYDPETKCWYHPDTGQLVDELIQSSWDANTFAFGQMPKLFLEPQRIRELINQADILSERATFMPIIEHFGHFLTQCTPFLSFVQFLNAPIEMLLVDRPLPVYGQELIFANGHMANIRIQEIGSRPILCKKLYYTEQFWHEWHYASIHAFGFLEECAKSYNCSKQPSKASKIYLSRSKVKHGLRLSVNEQSVEELMSSCGLEVVHPQELPLEAVAHIISKASLIVGHAGSAMHNLLLSLSSQEQKVLYLCHELPAYNFQLIDGVKSIASPCYLRSGCQQHQTDAGPALIFQPDLVAEMVLSLQ